MTRTRCMLAIARSMIVFAVLDTVSPANFGAAPQVRTQVPGYYRMMLGDFEVTALLDGTHTFPIDEVMTRTTPSRTSRLLAESDLAPPVEGAINAFLINTGSKLILIDSGAGVLYGADGGHLLANLRLAGYRPEQVDEVYLTHLHKDHVGGIEADGRMAFPNAVVRVSRIDADYWLSRDRQHDAPALLRSMFDGAIDSLRPYVEAGRFEPYDPTDELSPGIRPVSSAGHTPGHASYLVESRGQRLLVWGDIVHVAALQFPAPGIRLKYDSNEDEAETTRRELFAQAAESECWVAAAHVAFPGLGHIKKVEGRYRWLPAPFTVRLPAPAATP